MVAVRADVPASGCPPASPLNYAAVGSGYHQPLQRDCVPGKVYNQDTQFSSYGESPDVRPCNSQDLPTYLDFYDYLRCPYTCTIVHDMQ